MTKALAAFFAIIVGFTSVAVLAVVNAGAARAQTSTMAELIRTGTLSTGETVTYFPPMMGNSRRGAHWEMLVLLPSEVEGDEAVIRFGDSIFEEKLGPQMESPDGGRLSIVFMRETADGSWDETGIEVTYNRRRNGVWRRVTARDIEAAESPLAWLDAAAEVTLSNGVTVRLHPQREFIPIGAHNPIVEVRYEAGAEEQDHQQQIDNSLLLWREVVNQLPEVTGVNRVRIYARTYARQDRFEFPCGVRVEVNRDAEGAWPETADVPVALDVGHYTGNLHYADTPLGDALQIEQRCRY